MTPEPITAGHHTDWLSTADGLELFYQSWIPAEVRGVVVIAHGYAEHSGRYQNLIGPLLAARFAVYALDHRGHGRSGGKKGAVGRFSALVDDLHSFIDRVSSRHADQSLVLLGHSMGGAVSLQSAIAHPGQVDLLILSAPYLIDGGNVPPWLLKLSRLIATLAPALPVKKLDSADISRDPGTVHDYDADPLNFRGRVRARTGRELLSAGPMIFERAGELELPLLVLHGDADAIADVRGSQRLHEMVGSVDKSLRIYAGLYHEILNEPEHEQVVSDILDWLQTRVER